MLTLPFRLIVDPSTVNVMSMLLADVALRDTESKRSKRRRTRTRRRTRRRRKKKEDADEEEEEEEREGEQKTTMSPRGKPCSERDVLRGAVFALGAGRAAVPRGAGIAAVLAMRAISPT